MNTAEFQALQTELRRMGDAARGLAAIGAVLRLRHGKMEAHLSVEARLNDVVAALLPGGLEGLDQVQISAALASITLAVEEARDLFERPDRAPAWVIRDPAMLRAQGQASRFAAHRTIALAAERPALAAALTGRFLDVGTGVGAIALELIAECPSLSAVGIDIWEPALALARANVAASPYAARIEIRAQDVTQLSDVAAYTLAWLPTPFLTQAAAQTALDRLAVALAPSGFLVVGLQPALADPIGAALAGLRLVRSGGHLWDSAAMEAELRSRGFMAVETCPGQLATFVMGRRA
jgi:SAM-dependent methyltransferase